MAWDIFCRRIVVNAYQPHAAAGSVIAVPHQSMCPHMQVKNISVPMDPAAANSTDRPAGGRSLRMTR